MADGDLANKQWFVLRALTERWFGLYELSLDFFEDDVPGVAWRDQSPEGRTKVFRAVAQSYLDFFRDGLIEVAEYDKAKDKYKKLGKYEAEAALRVASHYYLPAAVEYQIRATQAAFAVLDRKRERYEIPSENDWGDHWADLDLNHAHKMFAGKTYKEGIRYLVDALPLTSEDLYVMPAIPFRYYIQTYVEFLMNAKPVSPDEWSEAPFAASSFLWIVKQKLERDPQSILPVMERLLAVAEHLAANNELYEIDVEEIARIRQSYEEQRKLV